MHHACIALAAVALMGMASGSVHAESPAKFRGLFQGIDPLDGSVQRRQITCTESGSTCAVLGTDTFFTFCPDAGGRGIVKGEGEIVDGILVIPDFTLTCADGSTISAKATSTPDERNQTLVEQTDDPDFLPLTFHRVNTPLWLR